MNIEESKAFATSIYKGKTYYFCSQECKDKFDNAPDKDDLLRIKKAELEKTGEIIARAKNERF